MPCFFSCRAGAHGVALGLALLAACSPRVMVGCWPWSARKPTDPLSKHESRTFLLARPISSLRSQSKLLLAAIMTAAIWLLFCLYFAALARPASAVDCPCREGVGVWKLSALNRSAGSAHAVHWKNMVENLGRADRAQVGGECEWLWLRRLMFVESAADYGSRPSGAASSSTCRRTLADWAATGAQARCRRARVRGLLAALVRPAARR